MQGLQRLRGGEITPAEFAYQHGSPIEIQEARKRDQQQAQDTMMRTLLEMTQDGLTEQEIGQALQGYQGPMDRIYPVIERFGPARQRQPTTPASHVPKPPEVMAQQKEMVDYGIAARAKTPEEMELQRLRTESLIAGTEAQIASRREADTRRRTLTENEELKRLAMSHGWATVSTGGAVSEYKLKEITEAALDPRGEGDWYGGRGAWGKTWELGESGEGFLDKWVSSQTLRGAQHFPDDPDKAKEYNKWVEALRRPGSDEARAARRAYELITRESGASEASTESLVPSQAPENEEVEKLIQDLMSGWQAKGTPGSRAQAIKALQDAGQIPIGYK